MLSISVAHFATTFDKNCDKEQEWIDEQEHMSKMRYLQVLVCYLHLH
jgi:hypothetical protein